MSSIDSIYIGKPDARDEQIDDLLSSFYPPEYYDFDSLLKGDKCFISGYKGVGKTALLFYLEHLALESDNQTFVSFLFFKETVTEVERTNMQGIAKRIFSTIAVDEKADCLEIDFEYIWRMNFLKKVVEDNALYNYQLFESNEEWDRFEKIVNSMTFEKGRKKYLLPSRIKIPFTITEPSGYTFSTGCELDFEQLAPNQINFVFLCIIDEAMNLLPTLKRTDIPYYLLIDELEASFGNDEVFLRDLRIIRDLIFTIRFFNRIFAGMATKTKIICAVRTEIISAICRYIVSKEINKTISGFDCPLRWNYFRTDTYMHPI